MKKFQFKFSVLLETRKRIEHQALIVFAEKQGLYQRELNKKAHLINELQNSLSRREALGTQPVNIFSFKTEQDYIQGVKQRIIQSDQAIFRAYRELERAFRRYTDARKKTKGLEVLLEKDLAEFKKELKRREQKQSDDYNSARFHHEERTE